MAFSILVRWHLYIESGPWLFVVRRFQCTIIITLMLFIHLDFRCVCTSWCPYTSTLGVWEVPACTVCPIFLISGICLHFLLPLSHIDGFARACGIFSVPAIEILQSCTKPPICYIIHIYVHNLYFVVLINLFHTESVLIEWLAEALLHVYKDRWACCIT